MNNQTVTSKKQPKKFVTIDPRLTPLTPAQWNILLKCCIIRIK